MKVWNDLGNGARAALLAGGAAVLAGAGWLWQGQAPAPQEAEAPAAGVTQPEPEPATASAPAASAPAASAPEAAAAPEAAPDVAPAPPGFDTVRIETDGAALVAGRAAPGAGVAVLVDGAEVASVPADGAGSFAALFTLPPSDQPRRMTLEMVLADGTRIGSTDEVAIAPIAATAEAGAEAGAGTDAQQPAETAEAPPAALLVTDAGAEVLTPPPADVPVSIDAISYAPDGAVLVAGHGAPGQALRLYLDNADVALAEVGADGTWSAPLAGIAPGLYTLRADQVDAAGKVLSRFETPFKRETVEALAAAAAPQTAPSPATAPAPEAAPELAAVPDPAASSAEAPATTAPATPDQAAPDQAAPVAPSAPPATAGTTDATTLTAAEPATPAAAPAGDAAPVAPAPPPPLTVTVQPGFTLWRIARENFGDGVMYVQVFEANRDKIRDPDLIYPGQVFTIPEPAE